MGLRKLLKKVTRVEVIHLGPGDVLHVHMDGEFTQAEAHEAKAILARAGVPAARTLVTTGPIHVEVIRADEVAA